MNRTTLDLRAFVREIPDFPSPGILFRDITPLLASPEAFQEAVAAMAEPFRGAPPEKVLGIEARGFMFGAALARELGVGFVPVRKPGKLPRETLRVSYGLEYGTDSLEIHIDACRSGERVLIADDVLATGGTAVAAGELVDRLGAEVAGMTFFIELEELKGRSRLGSRRLHSVLLL
ncbi:MAG TPA: adenine phosphoribosyltransferase [Thermoanaerobaculia bacterium]|nr:adenine phosphoribosyltransferase [Thermoanaerobaculia bacterium]